MTRVVEDDELTVDDLQAKVRERGIPPEIISAREAIRAWEQDGVCPQVAAASHACVWTCYVCGLGRPATIGSTSTGDFGVRRLVKCGLVDPKY